VVSRADHPGRFGSWFWVTPSVEDGGTKEAGKKMHMVWRVRYEGNEYIEALAEYVGASPASSSIYGRCVCLLL
jgi:hypothetical protein